MVVAAAVVVAVEAVEAVVVAMVVVVVVVVVVVYLAGGRVEGRLVERLELALDRHLWAGVGWRG